MRRATPLFGSFLGTWGLEHSLQTSKVGGFLLGNLSSTSIGRCFCTFFDSWRPLARAFARLSGQQFDSVFLCPESTEARQTQTSDFPGHVLCSSSFWRVSPVFPLQNQPPQKASMGFSHRPVEVWRKDKVGFGAACCLRLQRLPFAQRPNPVAPSPRVGGKILLEQLPFTSWQPPDWRFSRVSCFPTDVEVHCHVCVLSLFHSARQPLPVPWLCPKASRSSW